MNLEDKELLSLIQDFESHLKKGESKYFDVEDFEMIIEYYLEEGNFSWVRKSIEAAQRLHPNAIEIQVKAVHLAITTKDYKLAETLIEQIQDLTPTHPEVLLARATLLLHTGQQAKALKLLERAVTHAEDPVIMLQQIADIYLSMGQFPQAVDSLIKSLMLEEDGMDEAVLYQLAAALDFSQDYDRALQVFLDLVDIEPYNPIIWYQLGAFCLRLNQEDRAFEMFDWAVTADATFHAAYFEKGRIHERNERLPEALACYKLSLTDELDSGYIYYRMGIIENQLDSPNEALKNFDKAIELEPDMDDVYLERAGVLMQLEKYDQASKDFKHVWLNEAYDETDVMDYVECLVHEDRMEAALVILEEGCERFEDDFQLHLMLVGYLFAYENYEQATANLIEMVQKHENVPSTFRDFFPELSKLEGVDKILSELE